METCMFEVTEEDIFNKKGTIATEEDLTDLCNILLNGNILAYCVITDFFQSRFPLFSIKVKDKYKQIVYQLLKVNSAQHDNPYAKALLGWMTWSGTGTPLNDNLAISYITDSANQNNPIGLVLKGFLHTRGFLTDSPSKDTGRALFEKALEENPLNGYALTALGLYHYIYLNDIKQAVKYFTNAVDHQYFIAIPQLAHSFFSLQKVNEAAFLYAQTPYCPSSIYHLGRLNTMPRGIFNTYNYVLPFKCFLVASSSGYLHAEEYLETCRSCKIKEIAFLSTIIEEKFNKTVQNHEKSDSENILTPQDIFSKSNTEFDILKCIKIKERLFEQNSNMYKLIDARYLLCVLSATNNINLSDCMFEKSLLENSQKNLDKLVKSGISQNSKM